MEEKIITMSTIKEDKKNNEHGGSFKADLPKSTADFQCSVCGAIFTTDQDRKQHLEKEAMVRFMKIQLLKRWKLLRNKGT